MTIGIIGYGAFGSFVHELSRQYHPKMKVLVNSSKNPVDNVTFFAFEDTACCDIVIPAVPISALAETYERIADHARPETVVIDVATVKEYPLMLLRSTGINSSMLLHTPCSDPTALQRRIDHLTALNSWFASGRRIVFCSKTQGNS